MYYYTPIYLLIVLSFTSQFLHSQPVAPLLGAIKLFAFFFPSVQIPKLFVGNVAVPDAVWTERVLSKVGIELIELVYFAIFAY